MEVGAHNGRTCIAENIVSDYPQRGKNAPTPYNSKSPIRQRGDIAVEVTITFLEIVESNRNFADISEIHIH